MVDQLSLFDHDTWFGKMYQGPSAAMVEKTSKLSSRKSQGSSAPNAPKFLYLQMGSGENPAASWAEERTEFLFPLPGDYTMHSFGELPKDGSESRLSQILEERAQPKYYLSARACEGILRRAENRGKALPDILREALENQIRNSFDSEN